MEADKDFWEEFINIYRINQCLWNSKSKEYSDKHLRNNAYENLVEKCKEKFPAANKDFVVKKIHTMRCSFRRELKKVLASKKSGSSTDNLYISNLWYYDLLKFITDCERPRKVKSNLDDREEENKSLGNNTQEKETPHSFHENYTSDTELRVTFPVGSLRPLSSQSSTTVSETPCNRRRKRKNVKKDFLTAANTTLERYNTAEETRVQSHDKFDIIGKKITFDLRSIDQHQLIIAEKLINDTIYYAKLGRLNETSTITVQPNLQTLSCPTKPQNISTYDTNHSPYNQSPHNSTNSNTAEASTFHLSDFLPVNKISK